MKYNKKVTNKIKVGYIYLLCFIMVQITACDNTLQNDKLLDIIEYELNDEVTLKVTLDPDYVHESLVFDTQEEYEEYGVELERLGEFKINSQLFSELSHAFDPIEINMLDMNRSIIIDNIEYMADEEAIYSIDHKKENRTPELQVFYGLSGEEDLIEIEKVHSYRNNLEELATYDFKNPSAIELYKDFIENYSDEDVVDLIWRCEDEV